MTDRTQSVVPSPENNGGKVSFRLRNDTRFVVLSVGILVSATAASVLPNGPAPITALLGFTIPASVLLVSAARCGISRTFGAANAVTSLRLGLVALLIGAAADAAATLETWWPAILAALALALDGIDGAVARRNGIESRFGALFDQETDALLILVLTLILSISGKVGLWIAAAGLMRYLLMAAGLVWPSLAESLPKSRFRSAVCGFVAGALVICLVPLIAPFHAGVFAAAALLVLTLSFGKDVIWLLKRTPGSSRA